MHENVSSSLQRRRRDESLILSLIANSPSSRNMLASLPAPESLNDHVTANCPKTYVDDLSNSNPNTSNSNSSSNSSSEISHSNSQLSDIISSSSLSSSKHSTLLCGSPNSVPPDYWMPVDTVPAPPKYVVILYFSAHVLSILECIFFCHN